MRKRFGILVGGGPAPGINSVIGAATIRACLSGYQVVGIQDGYKWLLAGDTSRVVPLQISDTGRIHFRGGSHLGISRDGPGTDIAKVDRILTSLEALDVDKLVVIGGDGTGTAAAALHARADGRVRVVHVPKTIDNDLDLPEEAPTFGYQTARHHGVELVRSLMVEAKTTSRWFFAVTMGRKAGHLALGIGKSVGATLTMIPEEFAGVHVTTNLLADTLAAAILKRRASGRNDGIAVLAEGLVTLLAPAELASLGPVSRDAYGRVHLGEIPYGDILKQRVTERLGALGIRTQIVAKNFGYELRCVDPVPFDMELTRDLGYGAAKLLTEGGGGVTIALARGRLLPIPFDKMCDTETGRMRLRLVDVTSDRYKIARTYMIRLRAEDLEDPAELGKLASTAGLTPEEFVQELGHVVRAEGHFSLPPPSVTWRTLRGSDDDEPATADPRRRRAGRPPLRRLEGRRARRGARPAGRRGGRRCGRRRGPRRAAPRFTGCVTTCDQGLKSVWTFATCSGGVLTCPGGSRPAASCPAGSWDGGADAACGPHVTLDCIVACDGTFWTCIASPFP